jgi:hypothetical protein
MAIRPHHLDCSDSFPFLIKNMAIRRNTLFVRPKPFQTLTRFNGGMASILGSVVDNPNNLTSFGFLVVARFYGWPDSRVASLYLAL